MSASSAASADCGEQMMITGAALDPFEQELTLYGNFPSTINGNDLQVHLGPAILPNSGFAVGSIRAAMGVVALTAEDLWVTSTTPGIRASNHVHLTLWPVHDLDLHNDYTTSNPGSRSSLATEVTWDADVVGVLDAGLSPQAIAVWFTTTAEYFAFGDSFDPPDRVVVWSGQGTILYGPANDESYQNGYAVYDDTANPKTITLHLSAFVPDGIHASMNPGGTSQELPFSVETPPLVMTLDSNFNIESGSALTGSGIVTGVQWRSTDAVNPPLP